MMDLHTNTIVDIQLVQSNEVGGSTHMEKEGLKRSLALLESRGVHLDCIVTDRHPQVQKFLRERNITHYYDVWHFAKGISNKLLAISMQKDGEKLKKWMKSINNHIYWTAAGSTSGPERIAKWTSILNHVRDVNVHEDPLYPKCEHAIRQTSDRSKWLQAGYVDDIMDVIFEEVFPNPTPYREALLEIPVPEPLTAQYEKPDKVVVISSLVSRFKRGDV
ncbi:uncharacterized protein LOC130378308 [Gadus chalcogrammus]|uniref:uncharacterized protein LOC130378308 n=1 Tax=Gadus chalcogrammus TaxID=1042646 RepID=UPI0024C3F4DF|nr:uncharacterized protein LOC130378308 [Gadus chalcogrammus]